MKQVITFIFALFGLVISAYIGFYALMILVPAFIAYMYVFLLGAPLLKEVFLGGQNLHNTPSFVPVLDFSVLSSIFLLYAVPFIAAELIPVWKISVTNPKEAML